MTSAKKDWVMAAIGGYILLMAVYWFVGTSAEAWAYFYYINEKLFAAFLSVLVYRESRSRYIKDAALYCLSITAFMVAYFFYTQLCGHNNWWTVGGFIVYSLIVLTWLRLR